MSRRRDFEVDPEAWPAFDERALPSARQIPFKARRLAVELYCSGVTLFAIESRTGVERRHFYRLLERCLALHDDGRIFGWRGLVPHARVGGYERVADVAPGADGRRPGAAGAFAQLLKAQPSLAKWPADSVRTRRVAVDQLSTDDRLRIRLDGLKHLHDDFLRQCRSLGLGPTDYPFDVEQTGIRSLSAAVRQECLRSFGRGARLAGCGPLSTAHLSSSGLWTYTMRWDTTPHVTSSQAALVVSSLATS